MMIKRTNNGFYICWRGKRHIFRYGVYMGWYTP